MKNSGRSIPFVGGRRGRCARISARTVALFSFACLLLPFAGAPRAQPMTAEQSSSTAPDTDPATTAAKGPLRLSALPARKELAAYLEYAVDPTAARTIAEMSRSENWRSPTGGRNPAFGFSDAAYWIRLKVRNDTAGPVVWFLQQSYPLIDSLILYEPAASNAVGDGAADSKWKRTRSGDGIPFVERPVPHRSLVFSIQTPPRFSGTYYLRFESSSSLNIVLSAADPESFRRFDEGAAAFVWLYYGLILAVLLYNLFIAVTMRSASHGYFVAHSFFLLIFVSGMSGVAAQYFWPHSVWWTNHSIPISLGLLGVTLLQFGRSFLRLKSHSLFWDRVYLFFLTALTLAVTAAFFVDYRYSIVTVSALNNIGIVICVLIAVPYLAVRKRSREARIALAAMFVLFFGAALNFLQTFGFIAASALNEYSYAVGWVLASILLSFGLADQINMLRRQLAGLNAALEKKVRLRTADLDRARVQAENANRSKSEFLANMSHEIRTPMNAILGMAEMIGDPKTPARDQEQQKYLSILRGAGETLMALIDDILDLSRIEAGRIELNFAPVDVREIARGVVDMFRATARDKGLELKLDIAQDTPIAVRSDGARLRQILVNLVGNAIKFTERGHVRLAIDANGDRVLYEVSDTGPGIAPDQQVLIFEAFVQADSSSTRRFGGTGLGLAISRQLTELLGGRLALQSDAETGSRFFFALPLAGPGAERASVEQSGRSDAARANSADRDVTVATPEPARSEAVSPDLALPAATSGLRILVVEDNSDNRALIEAFLKGTGWRLDFAVNGAEGVESFRSGAYDLVLMDVQMPVLDGYEATRRIRALESAREEGQQQQGRDNPRVPIIALTAHAMKEAVTESLAAGCDGHLSKPVRKSDLLAAIARFTF